MSQESQKSPPTQLGMLLGIVLGAAVGVVLFALTAEALWPTLAGVGVALGLGMGATIEKREPTSTRTSRLP